MHRALVAAWLSWVTLTAHAATPEAAPISPTGIAACMAYAADAFNFNGTVLAKVGDEAVEKSFGVSDAAGKIPVTRGTRFNMASASKMFTAVAIGRLVDRGAIEFDAPIGRYLKGLKPEFSAITIAQLLNHTSGLGNYFAPRNEAAIGAARTATDLLPLALADSPAFTPGSRRAYSNSGFIVLGAIIEKVSGLSYFVFLQREIFGPLDMQSTGPDARGAAEPMTRMSPDGPTTILQPSPMRHARASPAGGMFSTASDIAVFMSALAAGRLVSRETLETLLLPRVDPGGGPGTYGYGFNVQVGPDRIGHGGGAPGVNAEIALYRDTGWQLIALSNRDPPVASRMIAVLEKALYAKDPPAACEAALDNPPL